ncbi:hypothetical protein GCM10009646_79210 [Streptomyces aureus]
MNVEERWQERLTEVRTKVSSAVKPETLAERYDAETREEIEELTNQAMREMMRVGGGMITLNDLDAAEEKLDDAGDHEVATDGGHSAGDIYRDDRNYDKCKWERAWGEFNAALHASADAHGFLEDIGESVDSGEKAMLQSLIETFDEVAEKHNVESFDECWNGEVEECDDHPVQPDTDRSRGGE